MPVMARLRRAPANSRVIIKPVSRTTKGYLISFLGVLAWSSTGILISMLTSERGLPAILLAFWRDLLVCAGLAPVLLILRRSGRAIPGIQRAQLPYFALYGFLLALFNSIWSLSVSYNGAAVSTVLAYGSTGFTAILAWWLFREPLTLPKIGAVIFSLGGCALVANAFAPQAWQVAPGGIIVGLLSGLMFALYTLAGKETARREINAWAALLYSFAFAAVFLFIFNLIPGLPGGAGGTGALFPHLDMTGWLLLVGLAWGPTILGYGLYNLSLNYLPASISNLLATLEPPLTAIQAYFLLGERLSGIQLIGSALVVAAVVLVRLTEGRAGSPEPAPETL